MNGAVWVLNLCDEIKLRVIPSVYRDFRISPDVGSLAYDFFDRCGDLFPRSPDLMQQIRIGSLLLCWEQEERNMMIALCYCEFTTDRIRLQGTQGSTIALSVVSEDWRPVVAAFLRRYVRW